MDFEIRRAVPQDIPGIMRVMDEMKRNASHPDWFVTDEEPFFRERISGDGSTGERGFTLVAEAPGGEIAGFFVVTYPLPGKNLGSYLSYTREQLDQAVTMDTTAVLARYRGHGLQRKMAAAAEKAIDRTGVRYLLCTIHPDNSYSLGNMQKLGYVVKATAECYGGRLRYVLEKDLRKETP